MQGCYGPTWSDYYRPPNAKRSSVIYRCNGIGHQEQARLGRRNLIEKKAIYSDGGQKVVILGGGDNRGPRRFLLAEGSKEEKASLDVTLIEATHRVGGKIQTVVRDGFIIEKGPDFFTDSQKKSASRLAEEVGMGGNWFLIRPGNRFVLAHERLHPCRADRSWEFLQKLCRF